MASKKSKTPTLTKKLRKRIENIAIQVIEAAGATYEHITKSEWGIIINEIAAETKLIEKNDFEITLLLTSKAAAKKITPSGDQTTEGKNEGETTMHDDEQKTNKKSEEIPNVIEKIDKKSEEKEYFDKKTKELKLGYVVHDVMRNIEPFDGSQSWPQWIAQAEARMEDWNIS